MTEYRIEKNRRGGRGDRYELQQQIAQIATAITERFPGLVCQGIRSGYTIGDLACVLIEMTPDDLAGDPPAVLKRIKGPTGYYVRMGPHRGRADQRTEMAEIVAERRTA